MVLYVTEDAATLSQMQALLYAEDVVTVLMVLVSAQPLLELLPLDFPHFLELRRRDPDLPFPALLLLVAPEF